MDKVGVYGGTLRFDSININQDWHTRHINAANLIEMPADAAWDAVSTVYGAPAAARRLRELQHERGRSDLQGDHPRGPEVV